LGKTDSNSLRVVVFAMMVSIAGEGRLRITCGRGSFEGNGKAAELLLPKVVVSVGTA
jgi:hypothetical protein